MQWRLGLPDRNVQREPMPAADPAPSPALAPAARTSPRRAWLPWLALALVALLAGAALWRTFAIPAARQPPAAATAYAKVAPSLVVIRTTGSGGTGLGTGFVANVDGTILTAHHVIDGATRVEVTFPDGTKTSADVASEQPEKDLATLTPRRLPEVVVPATLGGSGPIGTPVHAVGNPLGLTFSLSSGVISATGREIRTESVTLENLIQFDAAVNPGNSGGPLIDDAGRVVGVVTALANPSRQPFFVGIGFAVPITEAGRAIGAAPM